MSIDPRKKPEHWRIYQEFRRISPISALPVHAARSPEAFLAPDGPAAGFAGSHILAPPALRSPQALLSSRLPPPFQMPAVPPPGPKSSSRLRPSHIHPLSRSRLIPRRYPARFRCPGRVFPAGGAQRRAPRQGQMRGDRLSLPAPRLRLTAALWIRRQFPKKAYILPKPLAVGLQFERFPGFLQGEPAA